MCETRHAAIHRVIDQIGSQRQNDAASLRYNTEAALDRLGLGGGNDT